MLPRSCELSDALRAIARGILDAGAAPPANWNAQRRYFTSIASDLERCRDAEEQRVMAMDLYLRTMEIAVRSHGRLLDGQPRYLVRALRKLDPAFFERARTALEELFRDGAAAPLVAVAREVLDSIGGPLASNYRQDFPPTFRLPLP